MGHRLVSGVACRSYCTSGGGLYHFKGLSNVLKCPRKECEAPDFESFR